MLSRETCERWLNEIGAQVYYEGLFPAHRGVDRRIYIALRHYNFVRS